MIDAHLAYIEGGWAKGCRNATLLWRELAALGFQGRYAVVKTWAAQQRSVEVKAANRQGKSFVWGVSSVSRTARLLLAGDVAADTPDAVFVASLLGKVPALGATVAAAKQLSLLLRRKSDEVLTDVLNTAADTML